MKRKTVGCLLCLVAIIALLVAAFAYSPFYQYYQHAFVTESTTFDIADSEFTIEHARIGNHPMMAEYDRWISVHTEEQRGKTHEMAIDTCGGYPINCYLIEIPNGTILYLDDAVSEHVVDLSRGTVSAYQLGDESGYIDSLVQKASPNYIGRLDGKVGKLRLIPKSESSEIQIDYLFDRQRRW